MICNNKLKICNYNKKKLFFRWQACTNKPTNIFHKTLNQISVRVQLQTMHYSRHITRVLLCLYLFICVLYLSSECAVVMLSELFASVSCSSLISSLMAAEDGSSSSVSDSHFCKNDKWFTIYDKYVKYIGTCRIRVLTDWLISSVMYQTRASVQYPQEYSLFRPRLDWIRNLIRFADHLDLAMVFHLDFQN